MRIKNHKAIGYFLLVVCVFSLILVLAGEWKTASALWMVVVCLLPAIWLTLGTSSIVLKIYCATVLITQVVTVVPFYLLPDRYAFSEYRPFGFAPLDALQAFLILGIFLWLVAFLVKLIDRVLGSPVKLDGVSPNAMMAKITSEVDRSRSASSIRAPKHNALFSIGILFIIVISLPIKSWMFDMGIGLVGIAPPRLPFRLTGILFYSFNYLVPIALAYLYIKTKRNSLLLALIVSAYALVVGVASVSKSVVFLSLAPIIAFACLDRRWTILIFTSLISGLGVTLVSLARGIVHVVDGGAVIAFTELGVLGTLAKAVANWSWSPESLLVFIDIARRFEGFQSMWLASQFNSDAVGGAWNIFLTVASFGKWGEEMGHDAIHLEFLGYTIPAGLYGVGGVFNSWMMMAVNKNIIMVLPFATYAALILVILERSVMRTAHKYQIIPTMVLSFLFFAVMWFYTGPSSRIFFVIFTASVIFSLLPALVIRPRQRWRK